MLEREEEIFPSGYPRQIAVIATVWEGKLNMMAAGWYSMMSMEPPLFGVAVAKSRYTYGLIRKAGAFSVLFLPAEHLAWIETAGRISGLKTDKFKEQGIPVTYGEETGMPIIPSAHVAYECNLEEVYPFGDHDWLIGKVMAAYKDRDRFTEEGFPALEKFTLPLYVGKDVRHNRDHYLLVGKKMGEISWDISKNKPVDEGI